MSLRAEKLFDQLQHPGAIEALIGTSEDADFDCKIWRGAGDAKASISKAACGFANATGGVIVIGMKAQGRGKEPDLVTEAAPVEDVDVVSSGALDTI
jgi:predicted HTH transcriptional regulator